MTRPIIGARASLMAEGRRILLDSGYAGLGIKSLAASCGMGTGTFYRYFRSKRDLAISIAFDGWSTLLADLEQVMAGDGSFHDKLQAIYSDVHTFERLYGPLFLQIGADSGMEDVLKTHDESLRRFREGMCDLLADEISAGDIGPLPISVERFSLFISHNLLSSAQDDGLGFEDTYRLIEACANAGTRADEDTGEAACADGNAGEALRADEGEGQASGADDIDDTLKQERIIEHMLTGAGSDFIALIDVGKGTIDYRNVNMSSVDIPANTVADYRQRVKNSVLPYVDRQEQDDVARGLSLETVEEQLALKGSYTYAFTMRGVSSKAGEPQRHRKLVQYSYLDDSHSTIFLVRTDITEAYLKEQVDMQRLQRALEDAERANQAESMFLSSMSHDMRTPLNGIIGFTDLALKTDDDTKLRDYLMKIDSSGHIMLDLVNDVLDLSKIESGRLMLDLEVFDGQEMLSGILDAISQSAKAKGVDLVVDTGHEELGYIRADRMRLQQVLLNLLSNAVKYTPAGGRIVFRIECFGNDRGRGDYRFIISDDGIGMAPGFLPHVFEAFSQEHAKEAGNIEGTGLGLSIVKRVVDLMGGTIDVTSTKGQGTTFSVMLPIEKAGRWAVSSRANLEFSEEVLLGKRALLCEDNYLNAEIASTLLRERGIDVVLATDGRSGVETFESFEPGHFDVVLMDVRMPVMGGLDAARTIRSLPRDDAGSIPIIAMTADAYKEDVERCLAAGMNAHIAKPIDPVKMFVTIAEHIGNR